MLFLTRLPEAGWTGRRYSLFAICTCWYFFVQFIFFRICNIMYNVLFTCLYDLYGVVRFIAPSLLNKKDQNPGVGENCIDRQTPLHTTRSSERTRSILH